MTSDVGFLDSRGALTIQGRADDVIITGGEKVHPEAVEAILRTHIDVRDAAVLGIPDPQWGQIVRAVVVGSADLNALKEWCRPLLPAAALPRSWVAVDRLPRSEGGKLLRQELKPSTN
ncbi:MAG TPA: hypothetical protein VG015_05560 [Candidatus Dormibacteraeota bacterium]|nr:hypothetical protein [Candidatus Dormibacteraeota bacterium]